MGKLDKGENFESYAGFDTELKEFMRTSGYILTCASSKKSEEANGPPVYLFKIMKCPRAEKLKKSKEQG